MVPTKVYKLSTKLGERAKVDAIKTESIQDGVLVVWIPFRKPEMRRVEVL